MATTDDKYFVRIDQVSDNVKIFVNSEQTPSVVQDTLFHHDRYKIHYLELVDGRNTIEVKAFNQGGAAALKMALFRGYNSGKNSDTLKVFEFGPAHVNGMFYHETLTVDVQRGRSARVVREDVTLTVPGKRFSGGADEPDFNEDVIWGASDFCGFGDDEVTITSTGKVSLHGAKVGDRNVTPDGYPPVAGGVYGTFLLPDANPGALVAKVMDWKGEKELDRFVVGTHKTYKFPEAGHLYFAVNDSYKDYRDNTGEFFVTVKHIQ